MPTLWVLSIILVSLIFVVFLLWANYKLEGSREAQEKADDEMLFTVARRAYETGKMQIGTVDENGKLSIKEVDLPLNSERKLNELR
jgi:NADH:ubiquinone oxidoreductase subunit 3 (subunit A)